MGSSDKTIKENLKAPSSAKIPFGYSSINIEKIDANTFVVESYVDVANSLGAKIRSKFSITIVKTGINSFIYKNVKIDN